MLENVSWPMKVGDLVKLLDNPEVQENNMGIDSESVGIILEMPAWMCLGELVVCAWVQWSGNPDWDSMFLEDLEIVSESR